MDALQITFLNAAGTVLFSRNDMEQGNWTQEEYTVNATFPYVSGKVIQRGQRIFRDSERDEHRTGALSANHCRIHCDFRIVRRTYKHAGNHRQDTRTGVDNGIDGDAVGGWQC